MAITYNFDEILDRTKERSKTWDFRTLKPGQLPMNGAETHFTCPYPVLDAVRQVADALALPKREVYRLAEELWD